VRGAVHLGEQRGAHRGIGDAVGAQADDRQRRAQFMRDIGGEAFNRINAVIERTRHVAQRA